MGSIRPGEVRPPHRLARGAVVATSATLLGTAAHALAGGGVTVAGIVAGVLVLVGPGWLLAGRERGWIPIVAAQLAGQQIVHLLHGGVADVAMPGSGILPHDQMLALHVTAALLAGSLLRRGERRVWAAARRVAHTVIAWLGRVLAPRACPGRLPSATRRSPLPRPRSPRTVTLRHALVRRGPPLPA